MRSTTEFVAPPEGVSPAKPPPRLAPKEFTMSTPTIIKVARTVMKPRVATSERNIAQSSLREARMASIISCRCIEKNHDDPLLVLCSLASRYAASVIASAVERGV
jgi:hypothetical protein